MFSSPIELDLNAQVNPDLASQWPISDGRAHRANSEISDALHFGNRQAQINATSSLGSANSVNQSNPQPGGMAAAALPALAQAAVGAQGNWLDFIKSGISTGLNYDLQNRNLAQNQKNIEFGQSAWQRSFDFNSKFATANQQFSQEIARRQLELQQNISHRQTTVQEGQLAFEQSALAQGYGAAHQAGLYSPLQFGANYGNSVGVFNRGTGSALNVAPRAMRASIHGLTFAV
jgi:hypothetical protein